MVASIGTDFKIYDEQVQLGFTETLQQETDAFNAAANGCIVMRPRRLPGDYERRAFFKALTSLVTRRDLTANPATLLGDTPLTQAEQTTVKINRKIGPVASTRDAFRKIASDAGELSVLIGQQAAKAVAIDMLNTGLLCVVNALKNTVSLTHNVTAASPVDTVSTDHLLQTLAKAGDSANEIGLWVMHSASYYRLVREQAVTYSFDAVAGVNVATGTPVTLGIPVLMTDSPALSTVASPQTPAHVLGLRRDALVLDKSELREMISDDITGGEQLAVRIQGEYAYNIGLLGYTWGPATAQPNPTDVQLGTAAAWDLVVSSVKNAAGVIMLADVA